MKNAGRGPTIAFGVMENALLHAIGGDDIRKKKDLCPAEGKASWPNPDGPA
jgi:hypothetical protein